MIQTSPSPACVGSTSNSTRAGWPGFGTGISARGSPTMRTLVFARACRISGRSSSSAASPPAPIAPFARSMSSRDTVTVTELVAPSGICESISASTCVVAGSAGRGRPRVPPRVRRGPAGAGRGLRAGGGASAGGGFARCPRVRRGGGGGGGAPPPLAATWAGTSQPAIASTTSGWAK